MTEPVTADFAKTQVDVSSEDTRSEKNTAATSHLRLLSDQGKIMCAPAGCSLRGLAKTALDTAALPGKSQSLRRKRLQASAPAGTTEHKLGDSVASKHPSASANGSRVCGGGAVDDTG